jgi:6-phosphogluconolactonase (cycloisomerase 2 family)
VFGVKPSGRLTAAPEVTTLPGAVPFALESDPQGDLLLTEAGPNAVAIMRLQSDGELTQLDIAETGQKATCWIVRAGDHYYVSNAGSGSLSGYQLAAGGQLLVPLGNTPTDGGTVDAAATPGGRFLYVQTGAGGIVDEFAVTPSSGALTEIGTVTVPAAVGGEGVVAP